MSRPEYCSRETLARLLDMKKPGYIDQLVRRGILPAPQKVGDALRWRWETVDKMLQGVADARIANTNGADDDPLNVGASHAKISTSRVPGQKQDGTALHLPPAQARDAGSWRKN